MLIVSWNTCDLLRACLASIERYEPEEPVEVIVVDNASSDGSAAMVRGEYPQVRLIEPGANTGYAKGNNLAFAAAQGDLLLTLNPDTEFEDDSLKRAVEALRADPKSGALGARLVGPDGRTQASVRGFPTLAGVFGEVTGLARLLPRSPFGAYMRRDFDYDREGPAPQPMGTFLLFRREALEAVGDARRPFDERFPIFFNEVDLLYRMAKAGWGCLYCPAVRVRHHHGAGTRQVRRSMIWESHRSLVRYFGKHLRGWRRMMLPLVALASVAGAFVRAKGYDAGFRP